VKKERNDEMTMAGWEEFKRKKYMKKYVRIWL
jgi:hypothetical protein